MCTVTSRSRDKTQVDTTYNGWARLVFHKDLKQQAVTSGFPTQIPYGASIWSSFLRVYAVAILQLGNIYK